MIRLILLLLGAKLLRRYWRVFIAISVLSLLVGLIFVTDQLGVFRIGSALLVRLARWWQSVADYALVYYTIMMGELSLILLPAVTPHLNLTIPCVAAALGGCHNEEMCS